MGVTRRACPRAPAFRVPDLGTLGIGGEVKGRACGPTLKVRGGGISEIRGVWGGLRGRLPARHGRGVRFSL